MDTSLEQPTLHAVSHFGGGQIECYMGSVTSHITDVSLLVSDSFELDLKERSSVGCVLEQSLSVDHVPHPPEVQQLDHVDFLVVGVGVQPMV